MPPLVEPIAFGSEEFAQATNVSRETLARLEAYAAMLEEWNARHNLVSKTSIRDLWRRHFWDSAQLVYFIPETGKSLIDLGSGAGFPGLVLAELLRDRPGFRMVLTEATAKKCRFLEAVAECLALNIEIRNARIEDMNYEPFDVVTARAVKPLDQLFSYAQGFWAPHTTGLFLKGQNVEVELTQARKSWRMTPQRHPSRSDPTGIILEIRELHGVQPKRGPKGIPPRR